MLKCQPKNWNIFHFFLILFIDYLRGIPNIRLIKWRPCIDVMWKKHFKRIHVKRRKNIFLLKKRSTHKYLFTKRRDSRCFFKVCLKTETFFLLHVDKVCCIWRLKKCLCRPTELLRTACRPKNLSRSAKICLPVADVFDIGLKGLLFYSELPVYLCQLKKLLVI